MEINRTEFATAVVAPFTELGLTSLDDKISQLNNVLATILDLFGPLLEIKYDHSASLYKNNLCLKKADCQKMERKWCISDLNSYYLAWKDLLSEYRAETESVRSAYFACLIQEHQHNPIHLLKYTGGLLKANNSSKFTAYKNSKCPNVSLLSSPTASYSSLSNFFGTAFSNFVQLDFALLVTMVSGMETTTLMLYPLPTGLF